MQEKSAVHFLLAYFLSEKGHGGEGWRLSIDVISRFLGTRGHLIRLSALKGYPPNNVRRREFVWVHSEQVGDASIIRVAPHK